MEYGIVNVVPPVELQKVTREKDKLIDENEQLQQRTEMLIVNYEKEKQVCTSMALITMCCYTIYRRT